MTKAKYIIVQGDFGIDSPIVFSPLLGHRQVAGSHRVIAAGFCCILQDEVSAWGESTSLGGIKSRGEEDATIIRQQILHLDK